MYFQTLDESLLEIVVELLQLSTTYSWLFVRMYPYMDFLKRWKVSTLLFDSFHFIEAYIPSVYQQIEDMSKGTLPRRSKSFTRNDLIPPSRNSSPLGHAHVISSSGSRSRQSLVNSNGKVSSERDGDSQLSHNKSESWRSEQLFADDAMPNIAEASNIFRMIFFFTCSLQFFLGCRYASWIRWFDAFYVNYESVPDSRPSANDGGGIKSICWVIISNKPWSLYRCTNNSVI